MTLKILSGVGASSFAVSLASLSTSLIPEAPQARDALDWAYMGVVCTALFGVGWLLKFGATTGVSVIKSLVTTIEASSVRMAEAQAASTASLIAGQHSLSVALRAGQSEIKNELASLNELFRASGQINELKQQ